MARKPKLDQYGRNFGFTPLLHSERGWQEAYGYLGSYHLDFISAMGEIRWLLMTYPGKYNEWAIERIVLEDGSRVRDPRSVIVAQSKNADCGDCEELRRPYSDGTYGYKDLDVQNRVG